MDKFQTHGESSSLLAVDRAGATRRLTALAQSTRLSRLLLALNPLSKTYLIGGVVREALLGTKEADIDLACSAAVATVVPALRSAGFHVIETGLQHGTITIAHDGENIELTEFRSGQHGVKGSSLEEDLRLRDFTINAIAFDPDQSALLDPCHGISDLERGMLNTAGTATERFREDPLRLLRAIRFGPASGRVIGAETRAAIIDVCPQIIKVSPERIRVEIEKILLSPYVHQAFRTLRDTKLLDHVLPEMLPSIGFEQNDFHVHDVFEHTLDVIAGTRVDRILRWSALFHDLGKPATLSVDDQGRRHFYLHEIISENLAESIMTRLRFSNHDSDTIRSLVRHHMRPVECGPSGIRRLIRDLGPNFAAWREFKMADRPPTMPIEEVHERLTKFDIMVKNEEERQQSSPYSKLNIDGNDLITLGCKPGPRLGLILKMLAEEVIETPEKNNRELLLNRAGELLREK